MTTATITKGSTSVSISLSAEGGTDLALWDLGKPEAELRKTGAAFPRSSDRYSGLQNITLVGKLFGDSAYSDAITLSEMLSSDLDGDKLRLDIDLPEYPDNMLVALGAGQDGALSLSYSPGRKNMVDVQLSFTRVGEIGGSSGDRTITTPTATGTGPITLSAGSETVEMETDITVERSIGRPQDTIRRKPLAPLPIYYNKHKSISETISVGFLLHQTPVTDIQAIVENIFQQQLGRQGLSLDFNGIYGLGEFTVIPIGSAPFRTARLAGREGEVRVPTFDFSRITT